MLAQFEFNETSPSSAITAASSGTVSNAASYLPAGVAGPLDDALEIVAIAELVGATGGSLDVYLQTSHDEGNTWFDFAHFPTISAGGGAVIYRLTTSNAPSGIVAVGKNTSPVLPQNTVLGGAWGNRMRLLMVAGSGTSAGASVKVHVYAQRPDRGRG